MIQPLTSPEGWAKLIEIHHAGPSLEVDMAQALWAAYGLTRDCAGPGIFTSTWETLRNMPGHVEVASSDFAVIVNDEGQSRTS
jgi:hypothetical protein